MRFHGAAWDYSYAMYRSFRIERHVCVIYTDASMFLDQIDGFAREVREAATDLCP